MKKAESSENNHSITTIESCNFRLDLILLVRFHVLYAAIENKIRARTRPPIVRYRILDTNYLWILDEKDGSKCHQDCYRAEFDQRGS